MRVVMWTEFFWPSLGGNEVMTRNLLRGLRARGHEFVVVSGRLDPGPSADEEHDGVLVRRFPFRPAIAGGDLAALGRIRSDLLALFDTVQPDLLHMTWLGPCALVHHQLQAVAPLPTLVTLGQHLRTRCDAPSLLGRTLRAASWVATCTHGMRRVLLAQLPDLRACSSVVSHAVPPPALPPAPEPAVPRLLCLGRLVAAKGFDLALRALPAVAARHPGARMVVAGDGPERSALEALAEELGVRERVDFVGWVHPDETADLIGASTLVLMPSREETFGLVALETAWMGRAIVASGVEGLTEVVADGESGVLVPPDDPTALGAAVAALLGDPMRRARLGQRARERAAERFDWERHLAAYEALYERLDAARRSAPARR